MRCLAGDALVTELAKAAPRVALVGSTPRGMHADWLGVYVKRNTVVNLGYPSYVAAGDDDRMMWHAGFSWIVGSDLGGEEGVIFVRDGALAPEAVQASWEVWNDRTDDHKWEVAPALHVLVGRSWTSRRVWNSHNCEWLDSSVFWSFDAPK